MNVDYLKIAVQFSKFCIFMNNIMALLPPCRQFAPEVLPGWFGQDEQDWQDTIEGKIK